MLQHTSPITNVHFLPPMFPPMSQCPDCHLNGYIFQTLV